MWPDDTGAELIHKENVNSVVAIYCIASGVTPELYLNKGIDTYL